MRSDTQQPFAFRILARKEIEILEAIADRIFPKTDTPGAVEIGAVEYIDIALAGDARRARAPGGGRPPDARGAARGEPLFPVPRHVGRSRGADSAGCGRVCDGAVAVEDRRAGGIGGGRAEGAREISVRGTR